MSCLAKSQVRSQKMLAPEAVKVRYPEDRPSPNKNRY